MEEVESLEKSGLAAEKRDNLGDIVGDELTDLISQGRLGDRGVTYKHIFPSTALERLAWVACQGAEVCERTACDGILVAPSSI